MTSPMLTVVVLAVLWLIVVIPMVVRRKDESAGQRSVTRFGSAMRALGSRRATSVTENQPVSPVDPARAAPTVHVNGATHVDGPARRRPVPAAKEALMYPPDPHDMSEARRRMMARRRRSLTVLGAGTAILLVVALGTRSTVAWVFAVLFAVGLAGYLYFLRSQALRDRDRRESRQLRAATRPSHDYDATAHLSPVRTAANVVRIDEDDVDLDHLDTVDLTGLYSDADLNDTDIRRAG